MIEYLIETDISTELQNAINIINRINYQENNEIIKNEIYFISVNDITNEYPERFSNIVNNTFGLVQSFYKNEKPIHLIIINENMCQNNNVNLIAVILHELGHILNEFGSPLKPLEGIAKNLTKQEILLQNKKIKLENEYHADYFTKEYGYGDELINNLKLSLNNGFNDIELESRITALKSKNTRMTNIVRSHGV